MAKYHELSCALAAKMLVQGYTIDGVWIERRPHLHVETGAVVVDVVLLDCRKDLLISKAVGKRETEWVAGILARQAIGEEHRPHDVRHFRIVTRAEREGAQAEMCPAPERPWPAVDGVRRTYRAPKTVATCAYGEGF